MAFDPILVFMISLFERILLNSIVNGFFLFISIINRMGLIFLLFIFLIVLYNAATIGLRGIRRRINLNNSLIIFRRRWLGYELVFSPLALKIRDALIDRGDYRYTGIWSFFHFREFFILFRVSRKRILRNCDRGLRLLGGFVKRIELLMQFCHCKV